MPRFKDYVPQGVIPACLLPFTEDLEIDEGSYRRHLRDVADVAGLSAITVNAHATEVASCSFEEQERVLAVTMDEIGDRLPIVNGIYADGSLEAARLACMAAKGGASALLVFPPHPLIMGGQLRPEMALAHFKTIADATDLPIIVFEYPMTSGLGYPFDTLLKLFEEVPTIRAIKDWCADPMLHEKHTRTFQTLPRPINVLTTHSAWLMSSLVMGANGLLSGAGSVIADLQVLGGGNSADGLTAADVENYGVQVARFGDWLDGLNSRADQSVCAYVDLLDAFDFRADQRKAFCQLAGGDVGWQVNEVANPVQ